MSLSSLFSAGALITAGMLAGRLLGLLREMLLAARYGADGAADQAVLLLMIPDAVTAILIGNAASAALLPAFAARTPAAAGALLRQSLARGVAVFSGLALLLLAAGTALRMPAAPLGLALLALPLSAATAILTAWLQHHGRLLAPSFATVLFNLVIITALLRLPPGLPVLGAAVAAAALVRWAAHAAAALRLDHVPPAPGAQLDTQITATYAAAMLSGMLGLLPVYVPYAIVLAAGEGVALFNYALKLVLMPAMLALTVAQLAVLPWLVSLRKTRDADALARLHAQVLHWAGLLAVTGALAMALCAPVLAALCFGYGRITPSDTHGIAGGFAVGILALPPMLWVTLLQSMLYAAGSPRPALTASLWQAGLLVPLMAAGLSWLALPGVMGAFVLAQAVPLAFLLPAAHRLGLLPRRACLPGLASAGVALAVFCPLALWQLEQILSPLQAMACAGAAGGVSLLAGAAALRWISRHV